MTVTNRGYANKPWECVISSNGIKHYGGCFADKADAYAKEAKLLAEFPKKPRGKPGKKDPRSTAEYQEGMLLASKNLLSRAWA